MRDEPLDPRSVLLTLERLAPQARPYNFDDCFDCWGLVRALVEALDGTEANDELGEPGDARERNWRRFGSSDELVPGDLLTTHPHAAPDFHVAICCGRVAGLDLVYDSSPRGLVPLFAAGGGGWRLVADRPLFTRYMRATETTDRLRHDGGAWLRLWDGRLAWLHRGWHERLLAGGAAPGADLVALRRAAGLSPLPFYCRQRLPRDAQGREVYDNLLTRDLDYWLPDGAPLEDDAWEEVAAGRAAPPARPARPVITAGPPWVVRDGPLVVRWRGGAAVEASRVELWEETVDLWRYRLARADASPPAWEHEVDRGCLRDDRRYAVVVWLRDRRGWSPPAVVPFLFRPTSANPLLGRLRARPCGLSPDLLEPVPAGRPVTLRWSVRPPDEPPPAATVTVIEDGRLGDPLTPVFTQEVTGTAARECRCVVPAGLLRPGHEYAWYVTLHDGEGRSAFAPAEGLFRAAAQAGERPAAAPCAGEA